MSVHLDGDVSLEQSIANEGGLQEAGHECIALVSARRSCV